MAGVETCSSLHLHYSVLYCVWHCAELYHGVVWEGVLIMLSQHINTMLYGDVLYYNVSWCVVLQCMEMYSSVL